MDGITEIRSGIISVKVMPPSLAAAIAAKIENDDWKESTVAEVRGLSKIEYVAEEVRNCKAIGKHGASQLISELLEQVATIALNSPNKYRGMTFSKIANPQFTKYEEGHFIRIHTADGEAFPKRAGSVVIYLTDDYQGEKFLFQN